MLLDHQFVAQGEMLISLCQRRIALTCQKRNDYVHNSRKRPQFIPNDVVLFLLVLVANFSHPHSK